VGSVAREVRLLGFVPLASRIFGDGFVWPTGLDLRALVSLVRRRHVAVLAAERRTDDHAPSACGSPDVARLLGSLAIEEGRPHLVVAACGPFTEPPVIILGPMSREQLRRSVLCTGVSEERVARAAAAAFDRSGGWPGPFGALLRPLLRVPGVETPYRVPRAAHQFVRDAGRRDGENPPEGADPGFDTGAVLVRAGELANRGRHAAAERLLRRTMGRLTRRRLTSDAARVSLALGRLHTARGRREAAREAFEASRRLSDGAHDGDGVVRALVHLGAVLIEEGSLQSAESVLRAAEIGAREGGLSVLGRAAALLLARCLFWQGHHAAAWGRVESLTGLTTERAPAAASVAEQADAPPARSAWGPSGASPWLPAGLSAIPAEIGVRVALRDRDAGQAARRLCAAGDRRTGDDPLRAGTLFALAILVQGALGDTAAASRELADGLSLLRRHHAPVAAQELRIAHVEALVDAGARASASVHLTRLISKRSPIMSGLARSRLDEIARRLHIAGATPPPWDEPANAQIDTGAVVRILQQCHEADDDRGAVAGVCRAVRSTLHATAVSAFRVASGTAALVANDGGRACRREIAERAAGAQLVIGPESAAAGREAAAPVRYGGEAIGAVAARWPADAIRDDVRVRGVLAAAAAAVGPALEALGRQESSTSRDGSLIGELSGVSDAMAELRREVTRAAAAPFPVLVQGESGTGKELIAKAIHAGSLRRHHRFCAVNCAAISDDLFETELFGHARGAFTGAAADRHGLFEEADGGTLFLDEVGELSPRAQAKLLRTIQEGEIRRIGENHPRRVDTRIVAASNRVLRDEARAGRFRQDLLFRLDVVRIVVPPLRERPEDIAPLARLFWRETTLRLGGRAELAPATLSALSRYDWPGNVRELQNTLAALAVHAPARGRVGPSSLPEAIAGTGVASKTESLTLELARRRFEERFVRVTLARTCGRRAEAAAALGLTRQGLAKLLARLGIDGIEHGHAAY
jgi:DNA-binding NtrC family response regulator